MRYNARAALARLGFLSMPLASQYQPEKRCPDRESIVKETDYNRGCTPSANYHARVLSSRLPATSRYSLLQMAPVAPKLVPLHKFQQVINFQKDGSPRDSGACWP